jgi:hypothetical protein
MQMFVSLNHCGVIAIFPERSLFTFPLVVFLRSAPGDELHALSDYILARVFNQQMYMIGRDNVVVDDAKPEALLRLEKPMKITPTITCKLEEKFSLMTAVSDVPDVPWQEVAVRAWHRLSLKNLFSCSKIGL